jgi:hypothetical protein
MMKRQYFVLIAGLVGFVGQAQIRQVIDFRDDARNPSWSSGGRVLFERAGATILADGQAAADRVICSGCTRPEWHPAGRHFAFVRAGRIGLMDPDSGSVLDSFPAPGTREIRFSRDGASLAWMDSSGAHIRTGTAVVPLRVPAGMTVTAIDDFGPDGRELLVTAGYSEIYACLISGISCRPLTSNPKQRQDFTRLSPSGRNMIFTSSETAWVPDAPIDYESDLWIQPLNAAAQAKRMTWFNEPANPRYDPARARVNAASWSADGKWLLATITEGPRQNRSRLVKIEFPEAE